MTTQICRTTFANAVSERDAPPKFLNLFLLKEFVSLSQPLNQLFHVNVPDSLAFRRHYSLRAHLAIGPIGLG